MHAYQLGLADLRITLVDALARPAIGKKMLGRSGHVAALQQARRRAVGVLRIALQSSHEGIRVFRYQRGIIGIAFVATSPTHILGHGQRRAEGPVKTGGGGLLCGSRGYASHQFGIVRSAQAHVVRKDRGTGNVAVTVHGVYSQHYGYRCVTRPDLHGHRAECASR